MTLRTPYFRRAFALVLLSVSWAFSANADVGTPSGGLTAQARTGTAVAVEAQPISRAFVPLSAQQRRQLEATEALLPLSGPRLQQVAPSAGAAPNTETLSRGMLGTGRAGNSFALFSFSTPNGVIPVGTKATVDEPSTGGSGKVRFMTGNWYAAFTNNAGVNWTFLDPFTAFPSADGGFCCDQVALYEPSRDMMVWLLQYIKSGSLSTSTGRFRVAVKRNTAAGIGGAGWIYYDFLPTNVGGVGGEFFDYPHMALSNNYLYIAINVFRTTDNAFTRTVLVRVPLDGLLAGTGFSYNYISWNANFGFTPVQGATDIMYWASHNSTTSIRIFRWPENTGTYGWFDRTIPAWTATFRGQSSCPTSDGQNWCLRTDHRILSGVLSRRSNTLTRESNLAFFWNVRAGGTFPRPYVEAAKFRESDLAYVGRPLIWSSTLVWHYVSAAPNDRGDIGLTVMYGGPTSYVPIAAVCLDDDYNAEAAPWECYGIRASTNGPANNSWGDYLTTRRFDPAGFSWQVATFVLSGGKLGSNIVPLNFVFGRERERSQYAKWGAR